MKITGIETFVVDRAANVCFVFVRLTTDAGLVGVGEATLEWQEKSVVAAIEELGVYLIGEDPFRIELAWERMYRNCAWPGVVRYTAMSGVEHAMWDIVGKAVGQPVYNLLGGKVRERIKCYAWPQGGPDQIAESARSLVEQGFKALKMDPFDGFMSFTPHELDASVKRVQRVREAIGWDVDLAVDGHWRLLPMTAIAFAKEIEPLRILFFEEPCPSDNLDTLSELHAKISIPLAVGERYYTKWGFRPLLERQVVSIIQPDVCHVGGILECKKVAAMAEAQRFLDTADPDLGSAMEREFRSYLDIVRDPELKQKLTPDYNLGCTRIPKSDRNYYEAVQAPPVIFLHGFGASAYS